MPGGDGTRYVYYIVNYLSRSLIIALPRIRIRLRLSVFFWKGTHECVCRGVYCIPARMDISRDENLHISGFVLSWCRRQLICFFFSSCILQNPKSSHYVRTWVRFSSTQMPCQQSPYARVFFFSLSFNIFSIFLRRRRFFFSLVVFILHSFIFFNASTIFLRSLISCSSFFRPNACDGKVRIE